MFLYKKLFTSDVYKFQDVKKSVKKSHLPILNDPINYLLSQFHLKIVNFVSKLLRNVKNCIQNFKNSS